MSRPSIELEIRIASGRTLSAAAASASTTGTVSCFSSGAAIRTVAAPRAAAASATPSASETISATGVPTAAAAPSRPAALLASCPSGITSSRTRIESSAYVMPTTSHQPVLDEEFGELLPGVALVDDLRARLPRGLLGQRENDGPRRVRILRLDAEVLEREGLE